MNYTIWPKIIPCFDLDYIRIYTPWSILLHTDLLIPVKNTKQSLKDLNEIDNLIYHLTANIFESGPMPTPWKILAG